MAPPCLHGYRRMIEHKPTKEVREHMRHAAEARGFPMPPKKPISIYDPKPIQLWEWALVYPAFWLIMSIGWIVDRLPQRKQTYPKDVYRGGI